MGQYGDYCNRCGARKKALGFGYEVGLVNEEKEVLELCKHFGQYGEYCNACGDRLRSDFGRRFGL
jgi:hypothetical protein